MADSRLEPFFHHTLHSSMGGNLPAEAHLANQLLSEKFPSDRVAALAAFLLEAVRWGNERVAMQAFRWLEQAWDGWAEAYRKEYSGLGDEAFFESLRANILERCIELYAAMPEDEEGYPMCRDVRVGIIQKVARTHWDHKHTNVSRRAFSFLLAMGYPAGAGNPVEGYEPDVRVRFAGKKITKDECVAVEAAIREKIGQWGVADIERWFVDWNVRSVPSAVRDLFALARGRQGGARLMVKDLEAHALLCGLDHNQRSPAALAAHNELCLKIAEFDERFRKNSLFDCGRWRMSDDSPGRSIALYGEISCKYVLSLDAVQVDVSCDPAMPDALFEDMPRRMQEQLTCAFRGMGGEVTMTFRLFDRLAKYVTEFMRERIPKD